MWHFIIEVALVNARICFNIQNNRKMSQVCFREKVIEGLLEGYSLKKRRSFLSGNIPVNTRLTERHFIGKYENKASRPNCSVCSILPSHCAKKGKGTCKRTQTSFFCKDCPNKPPLCITPCFEVYHTVKNYKKQCNCEK